MGHIVSQEGTQTDPEKIVALRAGLYHIQWKRCMLL